MGDRAPELDVAIKLFEFEKKLGEISDGLLGWEKDKLKLAREGYYDLRTFKRGEEILKEIKDYLKENKDVLGNYYYYFGVDIISDWIEYLENDIYFNCVDRYPWKYCETFESIMYRMFIEGLREKGIKCGFIEEGEVRVSFVRVLESLRNCLHTIGIEMSKAIEEGKGLEIETRGICRVVRSSDMEDEASEICRIFAEHVIKNSEHYAHEDEGKQSGIIYGDEVQFKIGGAAEHVSVLNLKKGEFRYEDHNEVRLYAVKRALESIGLLCESRGDTLVCKDVGFEEAKKIARLLAFLPSLDFHIEELINLYVNTWMDGCIEKCFDIYGEKFRKECKELGYEDESIEDCISEKCREEICYPELRKEAIEELKIISAEALERVVKDEKYTYRDVIDYLNTEMERVL